MVAVGSAIARAGEAATPSPDGQKVNSRVISLDGGRWLLDGSLSEASAAEPSCTETCGPTRALGVLKPGKPVPLDEGFGDPPPICRVQCWWQCHGSAFTKEEITRQLEEFKAKGFGGVTVKDTTNMPRDEKTQHIADIDYMSPKWLEMFEVTFTTIQ
jgi:hypothetical protein